MDLPFDRHVARRRDLVAVLGESAVQTALRDGVFMQPWRGVVIKASEALNPVARAAAAMLVCGPDAVLSHGTAAALHGCSVVRTPDVHVTVPYSSWVRSRSGLVVHHGGVRAEDVTALHGLPVVVLDHAIAEVLCMTKRWRALACLDQALAGCPDGEVRRFTDAIGARLADRESSRGIRQGASLLRLGDAGAESPQESRLRLLVIDAGFPIPVTQYKIVNFAGTVLYRLDLGWEELQIGLEYDGYAAHEGRAADDAARDHDLANRGWLILRVRKDDLARPERFLDELRQAFARRGLRLIA